MKKASKLVNKIAYKKCDGKCYFCEESDYSCLDLHRINEGKDGGRYTVNNVVTCCVKCHRKIHAGKITLFRKHLSSSGKMVLHYIDENGVERFD
jgi:hypothetical protein